MPGLNVIQKPYKFFSLYNLSALIIKINKLYILYKILFVRIDGNCWLLNILVNSNLMRALIQYTSDNY